MQFRSFLLLAILTTACSPGEKPSSEQKLAGLDQEPAHSGTSSTLQLYRGNPRYLQYKGQPVILISSAEHYGAVLNLDFNYPLYLETLGSEGFNYTRIFAGTYVEPVQNIFGIQKNTLAPGPDRFLAPWVQEGGKYDLERFNPEYFNRLKDFLKEAEEQGIVVEVTLFTSIYADGAWVLSPFHTGNNSKGVGDLDFRLVNTLYNGGLHKVQEEYIRRMVRELNDFDNFFFELQNEPWADNGCLAAYVNEGDDRAFSRPWQKRVEVANGISLDWQQWVAGVIREEEAALPKSHLIAQNISNFQHELDSLPPGVSIINFHYALPEAVQMNLDLGGMIALDETGFMPHEDALYLDQAWRFILSGGGLYNNLDYSFTSDTEDGNWTIAETNPGWGGPSFRKKLSVLVETINDVPFHEMKFSNTILDDGNGSMKQYGLQKEGEIYLLFVEHLKDKEMFPRIPPAAYQVSFINVDTGEKQTETLSLGEGQGILSPFEGERLAVMLRKAE